MTQKSWIRLATILIGLVGLNYRIPDPGIVMQVIFALALGITFEFVYEE